MMITGMHLIVGGDVLQCRADQHCYTYGHLPGQKHTAVDRLTSPKHRSAVRKLTPPRRGSCVPI